jgi:hypothetical protein
MKLFTLIALPVLLLSLFLINKDKANSGDEKQKGVCWVGTPQPVVPEDINKLASVGVTWISQTPFGWQQQINDTTLLFEKSTQRKPWWGESYEGIATTTRLARVANIKTILKPHIWVRQSWPGEIEMNNEEAWKKWFKHYNDFIMSYAELAQQEQIEILCIGTELQKTIHRPEWFEIIKNVKSVYKGKLTYAANFNEFENVPFWRALDFIGIQGYFPLTKNSHPSVAEVAAGWEQPLKQIEALHKKIKKPVIFTELGYKSTHDATIEPWTWPGNEHHEKISEVTQANAYEAFFQQCWGKNWIAGVYFWKWYPQGARRNAAIDFTPQGKPAETVMKEWFSQQ